MDNDGSCFPSEESIAKAIRRSRETVRRALRELEAAGFLVTPPWRRQLEDQHRGREENRIRLRLRSTGRSDRAYARAGRFGGVASVSDSLKRLDLLERLKMPSAVISRSDLRALGHGRRAIDAIFRAV